MMFPAAAYTLAQSLSTARLAYDKKSLVISGDMGDLEVGVEENDATPSW